VKQLHAVSQHVNQPDHNLHQADFKTMILLIWDEIICFEKNKKATILRHQFNAGLLQFA